MFKSVSTLTTREWRQLRKDPWLIALVSWVPLLLFILLWSIFSGHFARDLNIGVVDSDHSQMSRKLTLHYDASPTLQIMNSYSTVSEGTKALRGGDIYGLIVIPANMEQQSMTGRSPQVTTFINSQFLLMNKLINSALTSSHATFFAKVDAGKAMATGMTVPSQALGAAVVISNQVTPLFNSNNSYAQFLVSAIIPAMWQILIVVVTVFSMGVEIRKNSVKGWLGDDPVKMVVAKLLPYTLLLWLQGLLFLFGMYILLGWPMHGNWAVLAASQLLMVVACQSVATFIFFMTEDYMSSMSLMAAYSAPGFAFMGITFPVSDMILPAQIWRQLLPASHYIEIQLTQANYGASPLAAIPQMERLLLFSLLLIPALLKANRIVSDPTANKIKTGEAAI